MEREVLGKTTAQYSLGISVSAGRLVFVSGTVATDDQGSVIGLGDMEAQARAVFQKIGTLLQEAGATLRDVVKITVFLTDMSQYDDFCSARQEVFGDGPYPTSTLVEVAGLGEDGHLVEVEAIAVI